MYVRWRSCAEPTVIGEATTIGPIAPHCRAYDGFVRDCGERVKRYLKNADFRALNILNAILMQRTIGRCNPEINTTGR